MPSPDREVDYATKADIDVLRSDMHAALAAIKQHSAELELRIVDRIETRVSKTDQRIDNLTSALRTWLLVGFTVLGALVTIFGIFG